MRFDDPTIDVPMPPTPYPDLNQVLETLLASIRSLLGDIFIGFYLQGSFALGDFDQHSDCDFIVVINDELSEPQVEALQVMHRRIYGLASPWAQHLEGSYFPKATLRDYRLRGTPLWYLDNGSQQLVQEAHCNTIVVRLTLLQQGVVLAGPPPVTLIDPIPVEAFRQSILESMNRWGKQIIANPEMINNRFYQGFAVLHYCRLMHDLHTGMPGTKRAGAEWTKRQLAPYWTALIDRAWETRPVPEVSSRTPADPEDLRLTVTFVQHILQRADAWPSMRPYIRPPDDVYWHFRHLPSARQPGAECLSREDGYLYRVRPDRMICRVVDGVEQETIDSLPLKPPAGAQVLTGVRWGFHMHISTFYQQVIANQEKER